jgi:hypothetical protein
MGNQGVGRAAKIGENRRKSGQNSRRKNINHVHFSGPISRLLGLWQLLLGSTDAKRSPIALQPCAWPSHWSGEMDETIEARFYRVKTSVDR